MDRKVELKAGEIEQRQNATAATWGGGAGTKSSSTKSHLRQGISASSIIKNNSVSSAGDRSGLGKDERSPVQCWRGIKQKQRGISQARCELPCWDI